jgi:hypothetical protein
LNNNTSPNRNLSFGSLGTLAHGPVLHNKYAETKSEDLQIVVGAYKQFIDESLKICFDPSNIDERNTAIDKLTDLLNAYRAIALPILEDRQHSGQENLRSTILEEFFQLLLFPLTVEIQKTQSTALKMGKANSYVSLTFTPKSFGALFNNPAPTIHTKDQDFVLGCVVEVGSKVKSLNGVAVENNLVEVVVPVIVIECKTYIERNMLDSCAGTAKRIKNAMPYCLYIVAAEYMKMDDAYPELTDIDEVFILTRATNSERLNVKRLKGNVHEIGKDLIRDIYNMTAVHLQKVWWSPEDALARGRIIARP